MSPSFSVDSRSGRRILRSDSDLAWPLEPPHKVPDALFFYLTLFFIFRLGGLAIPGETVLFEMPPFVVNFFLSLYSSFFSLSSLFSLLFFLLLSCVFFFFFFLCLCAAVSGIRWFLWCVSVILLCVVWLFSCFLVVLCLFVFPGFVILFLFYFLFYSATAFLLLVPYI